MLLQDFTVCLHPPLTSEDHGKHGCAHAASSSGLRGRTVHKRRALAIPITGLATFVFPANVFCFYFSAGDRRSLEVWVWVWGLGNKSREQNSERSVQESWKMWTAGLVWDSFLAGPVFSPLFLFWDQWKAIYPCVVRFDSWGGFFFVASHTCFLWCSVIFSLYIFFEIEKSLALALN